jgi:Na+/melibiose symporter-like transporter
MALPSLMLLPVFAYGYWYDITREKHAEIRAALDKRNAEQATAAASAESGAEDAGQS